MKLFLEDTGDSSVGISATKIVIEIGTEPFGEDEEENRLGLKKDLKKVFMGWGIFECSENLLHIWFEDECPDCMKIKSEDSKCYNPHCPSGVCNLDAGGGVMDIEWEKYYVSLGMRRMGGSFVKSLGEALSHADLNNTKKIKANFKEYWGEYLKIGKGLEGERHE